MQFIISPLEEQRQPADLLILPYFEENKKPKAAFPKGKVGLNLLAVFEEDFKGMALVPVAFEDLLSVQVKLPQLIRSSLSDKEKAFILSVKEANPKWELLALSGIDRLPGVQWKLMNIRKMDKRKHVKMLANLKKVLDL